jgi:hypothetical protein
MRTAASKTACEHRSVTERVERGVRRAKYEAVCVGPMSDEARASRPELFDALATMEALGLAPLLEDGGVGGNGALRLPSGALLVSASGRKPGEPRAVEVLALDPIAFRVTFRADDASEPTSDVALHWAALVDPGGPRAALHGHSLASEADATRLGLPISEDAMEFGTLAEHASMRAMLVRWPYPTHRTWIRRDHGFFATGDSTHEVLAMVRGLLRL